MQVSMNDVYADMAAVATGPNPPHLLYALWAAVLSAQKPLEMNIEQAMVLRPYVRSGLPTHDPEELARLILDNTTPGGWVYANHAKAIINLDMLWQMGRLSHLAQEPQDMRQWRAWRREVAHLWGLGWKTASFAALIMWPFSCPFVPVDSHVCRRLGLMADYRAGRLSRKSEPGYRRYRAAERRVYAEMRVMGETDLISAHHWWMWVDSLLADGERNVSHAGLCPRF